MISETTDIKIVNKLKDLKENPFLKSPQIATIGSMKIVATINSHSSSNIAPTTAYL